MVVSKILALFCIWTGRIVRLFDFIWYCEDTGLDTVVDVMCFMLIINAV